MRTSSSWTWSDGSPGSWMHWKDGANAPSYGYYGKYDEFGRMRATGGTGKANFMCEVKATGELIKVLQRLIK